MDKKTKDFHRSLESLTLEDESPIPTRQGIHNDILTFSKSDNVKKPSNGTIGQERKQQNFDRDAFFQTSFEDKLNQVILNDEDKSESINSTPTGNGTPKRSKSPQNKR